MSNKLKAFWHTLYGEVIIPIMILLPSIYLFTEAIYFIGRHVSERIILWSVLAVYAVALYLTFKQMICDFRNKMRIHEMKLNLKEEEE
jgi:hypothetical protein